MSHVTERGDVGQRGTATCKSFKRQHKITQCISRPPEYPLRVDRASFFVLLRPRGRPVRSTDLGYAPRHGRYTKPGPGKDSVVSEAEGLRASITAFGAPFSPLERVGLL